MLLNQDLPFFHQHYFFLKFVQKMKQKVRRKGIQINPMQRYKLLLKKTGKKIRTNRVVNGVINVQVFYSERGFWVAKKMFWGTSVGNTDAQSHARLLAAFVGGLYGNVQYSCAHSLHAYSQLFTCPILTQTPAELLYAYTRTAQNYSHVRVTWPCRQPSGWDFRAVLA